MKLVAFTAICRVSGRVLACFEQVEEIVVCMGDLGPLNERGVAHVCNCT